MRSALAQSGWIENISIATEPAQLGKYFGLEIDTRKRVVRTPAKKLDAILRRFSSLLTKTKATSRQVAKAYGQTLATLLATGPVLQLLSRRGFAFLKDVRNWDGVRNITSLHDESVCEATRGPRPPISHP